MILIRSLLNEDAEARMNQARKTAEFLKKQVDEKGMIDVGVGVERELGISKEKNETGSLYFGEMEGYKVYGGGVPQVTNPGKQTNIQVLCPPGTEHPEIFMILETFILLENTSLTMVDTFDTFVYPKVWILIVLRFVMRKKAGSIKTVVEIRRGVDDLSLGESHYAQVRIL